MPTAAGPRGAQGASQAYNRAQYAKTKKNAQKNKNKTAEAKKGGSRRTRKNRRMRKC